MTFRSGHELHRRRFSRNLGLSLTLGAVVVLVFALTAANAKRGEPIQRYDHGVQP